MSGPVFVALMCVLVVYLASAAILAGGVAHWFLYETQRSPLSCALIGSVVGVLWPPLMLALGVYAIRRELRR
jgi:hypothetical protein